MQPFRFIHAANLLLDHQLQQIDYADPHLTAISEDSTLVAFRQLIRTAIDEQVDFLLLAGNCFDAADQSLLGEIALLRGLQELDEQGIDVYILPGATDPLSCWKSLPPLPENTTILSGQSPISIMREEMVIATIYPSVDDAHPGHGDPFPIAFRRHTDFFPPIARQFEEERVDGPTTEYEWISDEIRDNTGSSTPSHTEAALAHVRYWVLANGQSRRTVYADDAVAHHPGGTQAISPAQTGPHGCTLVEVDAAGAMELTFVPTAAVRFENVEVPNPAHTDHNQLLSALSSAVSTIHRHPTDAAWLISWNVRGYGPARHMLADPEFQTEIEDHLRGHFHDMDVHLRSLGCAAPPTASMLESPPTDGLAAEYWHELTKSPQQLEHELEAPPDSAQLVGGPWEDQLRQLENTINDGELLDRAAALGREWFAEFTEESA